MENAAVNPRFKEILTLSVRERLRLLHAIVDSLEAESEAIELSAAQERELDRRWRKYLRDPFAARTWEEVREDMLHRRGRFGSPPKRKRT
jgi:putative addiction module component (TIGR02574 family)